MNELFALAVVAFVGPIALDEGDCGVTYTSKGFRPKCEESEVYTSKWDSGKTFTEYALGTKFRTAKLLGGISHTTFYPGGDNNQGSNGNPPPWAGPPDFICPPPFKPCEDDPHDPMYPDYPNEPEVPPVPLPAAVWMLLLALGSLLGIKKVKGETND